MVLYHMQRTALIYSDTKGTYPDMKYKYIFLDLDGTLTDPKEGIIKCVQYALDKMGCPEPDQSKLMKFIGPPLMVSFTEFCGFDQTNARRAVTYYRERFADKGLFENRVLDGAEEMLEKLVKHSRIPVIATSKPKVFADIIVKHYGLRPYLKMVSGAELSGVRDSKNEVIEYAIEKLKIDDRSKIIMVGDRKQDIIGAKQCGIDSCGVRFGYAEPGELEAAGADYIAADFNELYQILIQR